MPVTIKKIIAMSSFTLLGVWVSPSAHALPYTLKTLDVPFAGATNTEIFGINRAGHMVGSYEEADSTVHGFTYKDGVFATLDPAGSTRTRAFDINDSGDIVGIYRSSTAPDVQHGFLRGADGSVTDIDHPGQTRRVLVNW